ncbi:MAG: benzoyl-CoA 2,3-epoxidase subunit BoxB [Vulcanimicrobiaceae bacterium]
MPAIDYNERIPNNVDLSANRTLQRALEQWQPQFLSWWQETGPSDFQAVDVYLRTAIGVDSKGWANYDYVRMPDYRWGIFLAELDSERTIGFGDEFGKPVWLQVPGEHRSTLRRLIVTQGDTEPASVEQQRILGHTAPSLYDLRNLFQINVEEGRHLWAMVYLLQAYFGRDGREEAEALLMRRSGSRDNPRILTTFNEPIDDWLSLFMFTFFTDRDGKFQLKSLAESSFDPLARTCQFMLTEEAHHMFVGDTGIQRVVRRTLEVMNELQTDDVDRIRNAGALDLPLIQRYLNFWCSSSLDLFGAEKSSNAAAYFATGLKGRPDEAKFKDHVERDNAYELDVFENGAVRTESMPYRNAINEVVRNEYLADCERGLARWNKWIERAGLDVRLRLPSRRFNRTVGVWTGIPTTPEGEPIERPAFEASRVRWLPTESDRAFVHSLMQPVYEPGKMAAWIAPPDKGIKDKPIEYEYVRLS